jgi:hypothetical protein
MTRLGLRSWIACAAIGAALLAACSSDTSGGDGGTEAGVDGPSCGTIGPLCTSGGTQPKECPSCAPSVGEACSPASVSCTYTNGCTGATEEAAFCTCEVPDAGSDAATDAGSDAGTDAAAPDGGGAVWHCTYGV